MTTPKTPTWGSVRSAVSATVEALEEVGMDSEELKRYLAAIERTRREEKGQPPPPLPPSVQFPPSLRELRSRLADLDYQIQRIPYPHDQVDAGRALYEIGEHLQDLLTLEQEEALYLGAALGFEGMIGLLSEDYEVIAPVEEPQALLLDEDELPAPLLAFSLDDTGSIFQREGSRHLVQLGDRGRGVVFGLADYFDGSLVFADKRKKIIEMDLEEALRFLAGHKNATKDPLLVASQLGFERVDGELEERVEGLRLFIPAISRELGEVMETPPRFLSLGQAQIHGAVHLGPSSRPFNRMPGEMGDLYLISTSALRSPWQQFKLRRPPLFLLCRIASAEELMRPYQYASWGDDGDRERDWTALRGRGGQEQLLAPIKGFFTVDHLQRKRDLLGRPREVNEFLRSLHGHYSSHGQAQSAAQVLHAIWSQA